MASLDNLSSLSLQTILQMVNARVNKWDNKDVYVAYKIQELTLSNCITKLILIQHLSGRKESAKNTYDFEIRNI